tara:strand:+ start:374 stop:589 length:216 start_codon:yes stop_codon:yes gene_type:complete
MVTFIANTPQEKWIKINFESKAQLIRDSGLTRPTIDKICKDIWLFYKYAPLFANLTGRSSEIVIREVSKIF